MMNVKTTKNLLVLLLLLRLLVFVVGLKSTQSFQPSYRFALSRRPSQEGLATSRPAPTNATGGGYEETNGASKGLVSALTNFVNQFSSNDDKNSTPDVGPLPTSPTDVLERLTADYVERNYLWTGDVDLASFTVDCTFQDPTIRFQGRGTFVKNVQNLRQVTDPLLGPCRSELKSIALRDNDLYVETTWRMVGLLEGLFWKPCIDVPGRTKFWLQSTSSLSEEACWQVCRYEEEWDIPAAQALWQIVKPSGEYPEPDSS